MSDSFFSRQIQIPHWLFFLLLILPAAGFLLGSRSGSAPARCPLNGDGVYCTDPVPMPPDLPPQDGGVACTMDVQSCPDGSYVSHQPPTCEFAPCPGETSSGSGEKTGLFCGGIAAVQCPKGQKCTLEGTYPDAGGTCVATKIVKPQGSQYPAAGICADPVKNAAVEEVAINIDTAAPRCQKMWPDQRLRVINNTDTIVSIQLGSTKASVAPGKSFILPDSVGKFLGYGVHSLQASPYAGPEIWVIQQGTND